MADIDSVVIPAANLRRLGCTGHLIYLRKACLWLADHVELMSPEAVCLDSGAPTIEVHILWDGIPTFEVCNEAIFCKAPPMGEEIRRYNRLVAQSK